MDFADRLRPSLLSFMKTPQKTSARNRVVKSSHTVRSSLKPSRIWAIWLSKSPGRQSLAFRSHEPLRATLSTPDFVIRMLPFFIPFEGGRPRRAVMSSGSRSSPKNLRHIVVWYIAAMPVLYPSLRRLSTSCRLSRNPLFQIKSLQHRTTASYSRSVWIHLGEW
jgi:hypothetical protein